jgi:hypothetical protein
MVLVSFADVHKKKYYMCFFKSPEHGQHEFWNVYIT